MFQIYGSKLMFEREIELITNDNNNVHIYIQYIYMYMSAFLGSLHPVKVKRKLDLLQHVRPSSSVCQALCQT